MTCPTIKRDRCRDTPTLCSGLSGARGDDACREQKLNCQVPLTDRQDFFSIKVMNESLVFDPKKEALLLRFASL